MSPSVSGVVQTVARRMLRVLLSATTGILIAHALRPEGRGDYAIITTIALTAVVIGHFSVERTQMSLWADQDRRHPLTLNALILGSVLGCGTAAVGVALTLLGVLPSTSPLLCAALLAVPFGVVTVNLTAIALLRARVSLVTRGSVACGVIQCVPAAVLSATGHLTLTAAILTWTVSMMVPAVLLVWSLRPFPPRAWDTRLARTQLAVASRYHIGLVAFHFLLIVDILLLHALDSAAAAGVYAVAVSLLELTRIPGESVAQVVLARQATAGLRDAERLTARTVRLNLLLSSASIGLLAAVSPVLIPMLYGQAFAGSVPPLLALAPGMVALILLRPVEQYLVRLGRPITMTAIAMGTLTANVALNLALIPRWGAVGAGLASSVTYTLMAFLEASWFVRAAGISRTGLLPRAADVTWALSAVRSGVAAAWPARRPKRGTGSDASAGSERQPVP